MSDQDPRWLIVIANATPATRVGHVHAKTADEAIKKAIEQFEHLTPHQQKRLIAHPAP